MLASGDLAPESRGPRSAVPRGLGGLTVRCHVRKVGAASSSLGRKELIVTLLPRFRYSCLKSASS